MHKGCDHDDPGEHQEAGHEKPGRRTRTLPAPAILMPPTVTVAIPQTPHGVLLTVPEAARYVTDPGLWQAGSRQVRERRKQTVTIGCETWVFAERSRPSPVAIQLPGTGSLCPRRHAVGCPAPARTAMLSAAGTPASRKTTGTVSLEADPRAEAGYDKSGTRMRQNSGRQEMPRQPDSGSPARCRPLGGPSRIPAGPYLPPPFPFPFPDPIPDRSRDPAETGLSLPGRDPGKRRYCTIRWTPRLVRTYVRKRFTGDWPQGIGCIIYLAGADVLVSGRAPGPSPALGGEVARRGGYGEVGRPAGAAKARGPPTGAYARRSAAKGRPAGRAAAAKKRAEIGGADGIRPIAIRAVSGGKLAEKPREKAGYSLTGRGCRDSVVVYPGNR